MVALVIVDPERARGRARLFEKACTGVSRKQFAGAKATPLLPVPMSRGIMALEGNGGSEDERDESGGGSGQGGGPHREDGARQMTSDRVRVASPQTDCGGRMEFFLHPPRLGGIMSPMPAEPLPEPPAPQSPADWMPIIRNRERDELGRDLTSEELDRIEQMFEDAAGEDGHDTFVDYGAFAAEGKLAALVQMARRAGAR